MIGPNGAGKSTLLRGIVGILRPLDGSIHLGGLDSRDIAYLPQSADIDRSFPISVLDFVATGLWRGTGLFGGIGKAAREKILRAHRFRRPQRFREPPDRHTLGRPDAARAVCARAAPGRAADRAG